jgi:hypothetical protein
MHAAFERVLSAAPRNAREDEHAEAVKVAVHASLAQQIP